MIVSIAQAQIFLLAFTRLMAMLVQVPVLAGRMVPNPVRVGLGLLLTAVLIPWQPLSAETPSLPAFSLLAAIFRELLVGALAGFAAVLTFGAVQTAGELMGVGGGFGAGRVLNPTFESSGSAVDQFFLMVTMLLFLVLNGHHLVLAAAQRTFVAWPVNSPLPAAWLADPAGAAGPLLRLTMDLMAAGVLLAMPVIGASLLADLTLGLLARLAPQVQVFFLGAPLKVGLSLLTLSLALAALLPVVGDLLRLMGPRMLQLLGA
jgi:flagellar biosynthetic protein FliR